MVKNFDYQSLEVEKGMTQKQRFESWQCPKVDEVKTEFRDSHAKKIKTYKERFAKNGCSSKSNGMWGRERVGDVIQSKFFHIGDLLSLHGDDRPHIIFDFGGGCGNELMAFKERNPYAYTTGCDIVPQAVE